MKVVIPTIGSRGDVQPFIALAQGLVRTGHTVTLASHPVMKTLVESHGVAFAPIGPDIDLGQEVADIRSRSRNAMVGLVSECASHLRSSSNHTRISFPSAVGQTWWLFLPKAPPARTRPIS